METVTTDPSKMSISERVAVGSLTPEEGRAIAGAELETARNAMGIPTYHTSIFSQEPTTIAFNPSEAAGSMAREQQSMGEKGTAFNSFMVNEVAKGVPVSIALNNWSSGTPTSYISSAKADYYKGVNDLLLAGYKPQEAAELSGIVKVTPVTESQLSQAKAMVDVNQNITAKNPYWANTFAFSTTDADKKDAITEQEKSIKSAAQGALEQKRDISGASQANWEARYGGTSYAPTAGVKQYTSASFTNNTPETTNAFEIKKFIGSIGGTTDTKLSDKIKDSTGETHSSLLNKYIDSLEALPRTPTKESFPVQYIYDNIDDFNDVGHRQGGTEPILVNKNTKKMYMQDMKTGDWVLVGDFGKKQDTKPHKQPARQKTTYGSGFMGLFNEISKPKLTKTKPTTKKEKPVETWSHFVLTDRKITNTKQPAIKLASDKKPTKKESAYTSAWEQILFSKKKQVSKKTDKQKSRGN